MESVFPAMAGSYHGQSEIFQVLWFRIYKNNYELKSLNRIILRIVLPQAGIRFGARHYGNRARRSRRVVMVELSATPSTRACRKWRWKAVTTASVCASKDPVRGRS